MLTRILTAGAALFLGAQLTHAQGAADRLQGILSNVPQAVVEGVEAPIVAGYGNGDAIRWIAVRGAQAGRNPNTPNRFAALRSAAPMQRAIIEGTPDAEIRASVGLTALDWIETWEVAVGPVRVGAMDIIPDSEMRLRGAFFSSGFTEEDRAGTPIFWLGEADYQPDPARIDEANPFGGDMGLPVRMAFLGDRAIWATGWPALEAIGVPAGATLASRADAQRLVGGLRRVGNLGGLVSVRCWLRNGAEVPITGAETSPVAGLALADYAHRETEGAAMVLALDEGIDAEVIATRLRDAWPILSDLPSPAEPDISAGGGTITVTMRSDWGDDGAATNAAYEVFMSVLDSGRLGFLLNR
ncbi:hypothetical protein [Gymnodinialimonas ceratoperidinii]|uniref:Uncharacterized protein n=1 Tax=Gymnodinialimonas ceratoperidinii TaxID=2856823 RepID=A0A8F6YC73_9RHOB|nr:hypothetical protein [Gymnodinialimonas ceratoperidinii]QXT41273.1 hypothetical protein KYE46_08705 [Gymnodinialimonas ceratoperidinii]